MAIPASAQRVDGTLRGTVVDESGAVVPDAKVTATNPETGVAQVTTTTSSGTYIFPNLLAGTYAVTVEKNGFQKYEPQGVQLNSNQSIEANIHLSVGSPATPLAVAAGD